MKSFVFVALLGLTFMVAYVRADCGDETKNAEDGEVKAWFKNLGCKIQKGAEDIQESAKPWTDKISSSAKEFGSSVAQKYDELKHKLTDDSPSGSSTPTTPIHDGPTEKIPLAPISGDPLPTVAAGSPAAAGGVAAPVAQAQKAGATADA